MENVQGHIELVFKGNSLFLFLQRLITDLAANKHTLDDINVQAEDMVRSAHKEKRAIKKRQKEINDR